MKRLKKEIENNPSTNLDKIVNSLKSKKFNNHLLINIILEHLNNPDKRF